MDVSTQVFDWSRGSSAGRPRDVPTFLKAFLIGRRWSPRRPWSPQRPPSSAMAASDVPPNFQLDLGGFMVEDEDVLNVFDDVLVPDEREDVLKNYINSNLNPETQKKTKREVGAFEKWLKTQNEPRPIESVEPEALNLLLGLYIISVKRQDGGLYEPSSLTSIFSSVKRYLEQKDYHENIMTSEKFKQARDSLATRKKELKAQGMGNQPNKVSTVGGKKNCLSRFLEGLEKKKKNA